MMTEVSMIAPRQPRYFKNLFTALAVAGLLAGTAPVPAQDVTHLQVSNAAYGASQRLSVGVNKSVIVDLPVDAKEVIVSQPSVASAIMRSKRRAIVQGVAVGGTNIFFLDGAGRTISVLDVSVGNDASNLAATLARILPGSNIRVESFDDRVVLSGSVLSGDDSARAMQIAQQFTGQPDGVANLLNVAGAQQVMLHVTVSEVSRETAKQLGINLSGTVSIGTTNIGFNSTQTDLTNGANGAFNLPNAQINASIRALEQRGALRILAQPTLTAISGQPAEFLAGGELPYVQRDSDGNPTTIFKPYGVELDFTPVVKANGVIALTVDTSVSDPQADGSLTRRQAKTSVELPAGSTLAIGGLLEDNTRQQIDQLPGLGNIPILGALFRSREYRASQTELVILVTPYLVEPTYHADKPTDHFIPAGDAEAIFLGHLQKMYSTNGMDGMRGGYRGSVGFVLD